MVTDATACPKPASYREPRPEVEDAALNVAPATSV